MKKLILGVLACVLITGTAFAVSNPDLVLEAVNYKIIADGEEIDFENPVVTINGNAYIPLREAAENAGMTVEWDEGSETINIVSGSDQEALALSPYQEDGLWGYMDCRGNVVVEPKYYSANNFSEGLASVRVGDSCGYINTDGDIAIPLEYDECRSFSEGVAVVKNNGSYGTIDKDGAVVADIVYDGLSDCVSGVITVFDEEHEPIYYLDRSGEVIK